MEDRGPSTGVMPSTELVAARHPELDDTPLRSRYTLEGKLGRGGMAVVAEGHDRRIGRHVAIKRLAGPATPEQVGRFVREARIQGRLDHPAIAPVYDLGIQSDGRPYFVMRKLSGVTMIEILHRQAAGDAEAIAAYPRARLLEAFVAVCLAIEYAHTRGVVHCDLKPGNVMLGHFGEVYVLDWGVAWCDGERPDVGAGTVGYMAPEQREGAAPTPRFDIYALGCILHELLAGAPLHDPQDPKRERPTAPEPSRRAPERDIAVDLDLICARALATDPAARFPSARALAEAVERHLDADRDLAVRATQAAEHAAAASRALAPDGALDQPKARAVAMREAGQALALEPGRADAAAVARSLLLEPPAVLPAAVAAGVAAADATAARANARINALSSLGYLLLVPVILWQGVRDPLFFGAYVVLALIMVGAGFAGARGRIPRAWVWINVVGSALQLVVISRFLGPWVVPAPVAVLAGMALMTNPQVRAGWAIALGCMIGPLTATLLEELGWLEPTMAEDRGALVLRATAVDLPVIPTVAGLLISFSIIIVVASHYIYTVASHHHDTRRQLALQARHLRRLLGDQP